MNLPQGEPNESSDSFRPDAAETASPLYPVTEFEYRVAQLAYQSGMALGSIVDALKLPKTPQNITRVKRALQRAVRYNIVSISHRPPVQLESLLKTEFSLSQVRVGVDSQATVQIAAEVIAKQISDLLADKDGVVVVANAGGRTVRDIFSFLQRIVPTPPLNGKKLLSLSLNAADQPERFDECANSLCVRLAEIYGGSHFAAVDDPVFREEYEKHVKQIDFLISSVGAKQGLLREITDHHKVTPTGDYVGDVAFHLLDKNGTPLPAKRHPQKLTNLLRKLHVAPSWEGLDALFRNNRVLIVMRGTTQDALLAKEGISTALLSTGLAKKCVIELALAKHILEKRGRAVPAQPLFEAPRTPGRRSQRPN